jgi:hypothetical protein
MAADSLVCAALLFAACVAAWVLARPQAAGSRLYLRFAAILLSAFAVCMGSGDAGLGSAAVLVVLPLAAGAFTVAALARFARRLPDLAASLVLAAALAAGLIAALTGWSMLALVPVVLASLVIGVTALGAMAPLAVLGAGALLAAALAFMGEGETNGAANGVLLFLAAAVIGLARSRSGASVQQMRAGSVDGAIGGTG